MFLSRGDRDLGVAFQTHPWRQAFLSSGSKEPRSALESRRVSLGAHWVDSRISRTIIIFSSIYFFCLNFLLLLSHVQMFHPRYSMLPSQEYNSMLSIFSLYSSFFPKIPSPTSWLTISSLYSKAKLKYSLVCDRINPLSYWSRVPITVNP